MSFRSLYLPLVLLGGLFAVGVAVIALTVALLYPSIPDVDALRDYRPKVPLRIYTADEQLIGEFGEERREVMKFADIPRKMREAVLAAEDDRFYTHGGIDWMGVFRAALANLWARGAKEGASTITMQVARNFFLSREKTLFRKISEAMLAMEIERHLNKDQILELYMNQIYLGERAYGFGAAALTYYGRPLKDLSISEMAMLAGLPKAPSRFNPIANPKRAELRQRYVLRRMHELQFITDAQFNDALNNPGHPSSRPGIAVSGHADYVTEMARQYMVQTYGEKVYAQGLKVYTTLIKVDQDAAWAAVRKGVMDYDRRHGYRGPEGFEELDQAATEDDFEDALADLEPSDTLVPAIVLGVSDKNVRAYVKSAEVITLDGEGLKFAKAALPNGNLKNRIKRGSIIRVQKDVSGRYSIAQMPQVSAALVALDPRNGAMRALVGGFEFGTNKYNHVTQAWRQPGSSFKPFIYSAALEKKFSPASILRDELTVIPNADNGQPWEPKNYEPEYDGPIRLRVALAKSKNTVAVKLLQAIGPGYAQDYITRFGFDANRHPAYLSMALGSGQVTPLQMAAAYSVFANGGYQIKPYFIEKITDNSGRVLSQSEPLLAGTEAPVIDPRNAFLMTSMMGDVIRMGTAQRAMSLGRGDLAGKTGTTSDHIDAWFAGYQASLVTVSWIGFDTPATLGMGETGAQAALPIWMDFMGRALQGVPEYVPIPPPGLVNLMVDPTTGRPGGRNRYSEWFYQENVATSDPDGLDSLSEPMLNLVPPGIPLDSTKKPDH